MSGSQGMVNRGPRGPSRRGVVKRLPLGKEFFALLMMPGWWFLVAVCCLLCGFPMFLFTLPLFLDSHITSFQLRLLSPKTLYISCTDLAFHINSLFISVSVFVVNGLLQLVVETRRPPKLALSQTGRKMRLCVLQPVCV